MPNLYNQPAAGGQVSAPNNALPGEWLQDLIRSLLEPPARGPEGNSPL